MLCILDELVLFSNKLVSFRVAGKITKELKGTSLRSFKALKEKLLKLTFLLSHRSLSPRALVQEETKVTTNNIYYNRVATAGENSGEKLGSRKSQGILYKVRENLSFHQSQTKVNNIDIIT